MRVYLPFSNLSFFSLIVSNDYSIYTFLILNWNNLIEIYKNIIKLCHQLIIKKELSVFKQEYKFNLYSIRSYKNFNMWNVLNWLNEKEKTHTHTYHSWFLWKIKLSETKNFYLWDFFLNFLYFTKLKIAETVYLLNIIASVNIFNSSLWKSIFFSIIKTYHLKIDWSVFSIINWHFSLETKWKFLKKKYKHSKILQKNFMVMLNLTNFF
mmetsp:Transcript_37352/g.99442  ORF Transcript_37352/g.99442 Transcript_37352/m.99442 type:complete len:209 (+) Transcript_37352:3401-4027(+)